MAPEPPMSPGGVCLDPHASGQAVPGTKQPPRDCIGQTRGSTWRVGASRHGGYEFPGYDHHGKASVSARKLGLKEGVGFNPRVNFDGERKVSHSAGSPPCLRTTAPPPPHQLPSALHHFDGGDHFDLRQPCLLMIEVGRRVTTSPTTETGEQPSLSSGWSDAPSV